MRWSSLVLRRAKEQSTAPNDAALIRNSEPVPTAAMRRPASAGPIMRAALNEVEFSPTAFDSPASPTSSETKAWRAGASKADTEPSRRANV